MPSLGSARVVRPDTLTAEVLYLLSRGGHLEHPHMICVPYAAHQPGPSLRDVKARLIALRGKGMPGSFSWSYKRNYKDSFIWCDLFDDDCVLPLSATGEYVLKAMELFDADDDGDSYQQLRYRVSSPGARPEHRHVENDVSMAIKKSLLLINTPGDNSIDLNKEIMKNLSYSKRGAVPDVCSIEHSEVSSSTATYEDTDKSKHSNNLSPKTTTTTKHSPNANDDTEKEHPERQSIGRIAIAKCCSNAGSQTPTRQQRDVTTDCKELESPKPESPATTTTTTTESMTLGPQSAHLLKDNKPQEAKRGTWQKEMDKSTICTQFVYHKSSDDEQPSPTEDPFFYGVLRKATRLGSSFRPRLCRGVDIVDSTRTKTKLSKSKHEDVVVAANPKPEPTVKEFKTLSEYFETQERQTPLSICAQLISEEPISVKEEIQASQSLVTESDPVTPARSQSRPFGNEALDASYRKTMEVLAKLPTSRGACRIHTDPVPARSQSISGAQKLVRSESKGNKVDMTRSSSRQGFKPDGAIVHDTCSIHGMESAPPKQRARSSVKKGSMAGFEASTVSCRAKAVVKSADEKPLKPGRSGSKESSTNSDIVEDGTKSESFTFDSRGMHSGNKQGSKIMATQAATKVEETKPSSNEGAKGGWPFEQPARPRDFQSREDRPLTPGLTNMDWERSFQEAVISSEPPVDLVLHECSQCGRTFKLDSLQVHMRGCHAVNKPKSSLPAQRRVSL